MVLRRRRKGWVVLLAIVAVVAYLATGDRWQTVESWLADQGLIDSGSVGLVVTDTSVPPARLGTTVIRGRLTNESDKRYRVVRVRFELLGESGNVVGEAFKYLSIVEPGTTREFEAPTGGAGFMDYRLAEVKGW